MAFVLFNILMVSVEIPPDYDEAKDFSNDPTGTRPKPPSRQTSRSSRNSSSSGTRNRRPGFRRSVSSDERRHRPKMFSQRSVPGSSRTSRHPHSSDSVLPTEPDTSPVLVSITDRTREPSSNTEPSSHNNEVNNDSSMEADVFEESSLQYGQNEASTSTVSTRVSFF